MKIEKLPSGSYRVRKTFNKKTYNIVFDHKPTDQEILKALSDKVETVIEGAHITFEAAASEYCKLKKNVISPTTYREYKQTPDRLSKDFNALYIDQLTNLHIQQEINRLSEDKSPKTVRNYHAFIVSVIKMYREDFKVKTTLPLYIPDKPYVPTDEEVKKVIEYSKTHCDGRYTIPILLACYGLRRSEICSLTCDDISDNIVRINKARVFNYEKKWEIKDTTKNETSTRSVPISPELSEMIRKQGYVYEGHPNNITDFIYDACDALCIQRFSIHKLRHFFCTRLSSENIDTETIMALGGWKTDYTMKSHYRHSVSEKVQDASDRLGAIIFQ